MMHGMGGGIGATMIMGWPLADWAVIMLLLIVSSMVIAFLTAILTLFKPQANSRDRQHTQGVPPSQPDRPLSGAIHQPGLTDPPVTATTNQPQSEGIQDA